MLMSYYNHPGQTSSTLLIDYLSCLEMWHSSDILGLEIMSQMQTIYESLICLLISPSLEPQTHFQHFCPTWDHLSTIIISFQKIPVQVWLLVDALLVRLPSIISLWPYSTKSCQPEKKQIGIYLREPSLRTFLSNVPYRISNCKIQSKQININSSGSTSSTPLKIWPSDNVPSFGTNLDSSVVNNPKPISSHV